MRDRRPVDSVEQRWHSSSIVPDSASPADLRTSFAPWRLLHVSQAEVHARVQRIQDLEAEGRIDEALALGEATLEYAPFEPQLLLWLVRAYAARGDAEAHAKHLTIAFYVNVLDKKSARADTSLRGALPLRAFAANLLQAQNAIGRDRTRDFYFTETEPRQDTFCTKLQWRREHTDAVVAALRRFCADMALVYRVIFPEQEWYDDYLDWIEARVGDRSELELEADMIPSAFCHLGRVVVLLQELAPFIDDVRTFLFDQTSPLYEVWVVDHAWYVRRHAIYAQDEMWEYLDDLMQRNGIRDAPLERLLVEHFTTEAAGWLEGGGSAYLDADECKQKAEQLLARAARLGEPAPLVRARMDLIAGDEDQAIAALERIVQQQDPTAHAAQLELLDLYLARDRFADALRLLEHTKGVDQHRWGVAYEGAGLLDKARAAYAVHAKGMLSGSSGVLLRQANELFDRGWHESARGYYSELSKTTQFSTPIRAELGLALCAERRAALAEATEHCERVLARAPAQKRTYDDSPSIAAAIEHCEHTAVRWLHARRLDPSSENHPNGGATLSKI